MATHIIVPNREIYFNEPANTKPEELATEVPVPVEKNG